MSTPTATGYEVYDRQRVRAILEGISREEMRALVGEGWQGPFEENVFDGEYEPTGDHGNPALVAVWALDYEEEPESVLDPEAPVAREGVVKIAIRIQPGAGTELVYLAFQKLREAFREASDPSDIHYFVESPSLAYGKDRDSGWWLAELPIRFQGV